MEQTLLFLSAGLVGGMINVAAGGAKLFVFPMLLASGLPPVVANASATVGLWPAQLPAAWIYRHELLKGSAVLKRQLPVAMVGALLGALALIFSSQKAFLALVPFLLIIAVTSIIAGRRLAVLMQRFVPDSGVQRTALTMLFATGFYGGYFGAGQGFVLLATFTIAGVATMREANARKNLFGFCINLTAIVPLACSGLVHWVAAVAVLVGGIAGGYIGGRVLHHIPERPLRIGVAILGVVLTASYLIR